VYSISKHDHSPGIERPCILEGPFDFEKKKAVRDVLCSLLTLHG
jgi:hypothetical protein